MQVFDKNYIEDVLVLLSDNSWLFPQFELTRQENGLKLLGMGGFSSVYEMYNKERPENIYALKVIGFTHHTISSEEFKNIHNIQWILSQESKYIVRALEIRELALTLEDDGTVSKVKEVTKEVWEENDNTLHLQFVLMEKLDELIEKNRFRFSKCDFLRKELKNESEIFKLVFEIGQAIALMHTNHCLHRDIKMENIFWDSANQVYKLGDFGIAKWTEDGNAETIVYSDGYGAPEIERMLYDNYNATADIYSFGITLYLLFNDLRFPGSDGYYSKGDVQYNPNFIFPAPAHASETMTRVIRKMCSYSAEDRYQSMYEVLEELSKVLNSENIEHADELYELADIATETYREESEKEIGDIVEEEDENETIQEKELKRSERKKQYDFWNRMMKKANQRYYCLITILLLMILKGLQPNISVLHTNRLYLVLPLAILLEVVLLKLREFHVIFGGIVIALLGLSIYFSGPIVANILLIICVLSGSSTVLLSGATSVGCWMLFLEAQEIAKQYGETARNYIYKWDISWVVLVALFFTIYKYLECSVMCKRQITKVAIDKNTIKNRLSDKIYETLYFDIYEKIAIAIAFIGLVLLLLQRLNYVILPNEIKHMYLFQTGILTFIIIQIYEWIDMNIFNAMESGEE